MSDRRSEDSIEFEAFDPQAAMQSDFHEEDQSEVIIPDHVMIELQRSMRRLGLRSKEAPFFLGILNNNRPYSYFAFRTTSNDNQENVIVIAAGEGATSMIHNTHEQPWVQVIKYFVNVGYGQEITPEDVFEDYKEQQVDELAKQIGSPIRNFNLIPESTESTTIDLVNITSCLVGTQDPKFQIMIEEQTVCPSLALFYRVPAAVNGLGKSTVVVIYWEHDLTTVKKDLFSSCRFALGEESDPASTFSTFAPSHLLKRNLLKSLKHGQLKASDYIGLDIENNEYMSGKVDGIMHMNIQGVQLAQLFNRSYRRFNISRQISEELLKQFDRFTRRALEVFIYEYMDQPSLVELTQQRLDSRLSQIKEELAEKDIEAFMEIAKRKLHEDLFGEDSEIEDITELIQQRFIDGAEGFTVNYEPSEDIAIFKVKSLEMKRAFGDTTYRIVIEHRGNMVILNAFKDERKPVIPTRSALSKLGATLRLTSEQPAVTHEVKSQEITNEIEILLACSRIINEDDTVGSDLLYELCIQKNLRQIELAKTDPSKVGCYITEIDDEGRPIHIVIPLPQINLELVRVTIPPTDKDGWIQVRGIDRVRFVCDGEKFDNLLNQYLVSQDISLINELINDINAGRDFAFDTSSLLSDSEADLDDDEDYDDDVLTNTRSLYSGSLFDDLGEDEDEPELEGIQK